MICLGLSEGKFVNNAIEIAYFFYQHYKFLLNFKKRVEKPSLMDSAAQANGASGVGRERSFKKLVSVSKRRVNNSK